MMKNRFLAAAMAVLAGVAFVSCEEKEPEPIDEVIEVNISAPAAEFDANGEASVSLSLSAASSAEVAVTLGVGATAEEGLTAIDAASLTLETSVVIPAGTQAASVKVSVNTEAVEPGQEAVIIIASSNGAVVGENATAYIKVPAGGYNHGEEAVDLSGATVWGIVGTFNGWGDGGSDAILTKTNDSPEEWTITGLALGGEFKFRGNKEWDKYDLGASSAVELGKELALVHKGSNITIEEGVYDIVLYPTELKAKFTAGEVPPVANELDWTVKYNGCSWVEGYYSYGELESFEVSNTDTDKYYLPIIVDLAEDGDLAATIAADPDAYFAELQEEVTAEIEEDMETWGDSLEEAMAYLFYNEINDGTDLLFNGLPVGDYQFVVISMSDEGVLDQCYKVLSFSKTEDPLAIYPWNDSYNKRDDWSVEWDGWCEGDEGEYYWIVGNAPGATYVYVDSYTDDELDYYYDGSMVDMYNYTASSLADYIAAGFTAEELADYGLITPVESDGSFESYLSTYEMTGETNVYIIAFDAEGGILSDYGVSVIDIPEYIPEPIDWVERTDWAANYDATVDTGNEKYPDAIVITACDAEYFIAALYNPGSLEEEGIDAIGREAAGQIQEYIGMGYSMDELVNKYGAVHTSVPAVEAWAGLFNGVEIYLFGLNADGSATGEWHMEVLEGYEEKPIELPEMILQENWSVTPVGEVYDDDGDDVIDVEVNAPGILWYFIEENTDEDLVEYYEGDIAYLAVAMEQQLADYLDYGYTMDELLWSENDPEGNIFVYNTDTPTSLYIIEFDENGKATGRYGKSDVTIPSSGAYSAKARASVHQPSLKVNKPIVRNFSTKEVKLSPKHAGQKRVVRNMEISIKAQKSAKAARTSKKIAKVRVK